MGQDGAAAIAAGRKEIGGEGLAVYLLMLSQVDYENTILMSQAEIAEQLGMHKQHVSRAVKRLIDFGAIQPTGKVVGKVKGYRLNPRFGWKGQGAGHRKALGGIHAE